MNQKVLEKIVRQFSLNPHGIHGIEHWIRAHENGYRLAETTGANVKVVIWFAILHDCQRVSNAGDPNHGPRAVTYSREHRKEIDLDDSEFELLFEAISCHTKGCNPNADITVQTCLDADRLDITRSRSIVDQAHLYTDAAKSETMRSKSFRNPRSRKLARQ